MRKLRKGETVGCVWVVRLDTAQLPALGPCPFHDTSSLETDGSEDAELINSSIDPGFSIQEIDLPIRKGREALSEGQRCLETHSAW